MKLLALDTEVTTWNKGNPFDRRNWLVCSSFATDTEAGCVAGVEGIQDRINDCDCIILFNAKFDIHWFRKYGISFKGKRILDGQVAEFILSYQTIRFPSLDSCAEKYLGEHKIDVIKEKYWDQGINTHEIPWEELSAYAKKDAILTLGVIKAQLERLTSLQRRLLHLQCADTMVLAEMEWNGLKYNEELCDERSQELENKIQNITRQLQQVYPAVPINFNSGDHLSAFLYGGVVKEETKEHIGFYKSGLKAGQPKFRNVTIEHQLPRLCEPIKGSALKKEGYFATNEDTLKKTKGAKQYIDLILELSRLEKMNGTYYRGLPKLNKEMNWESGTLHGTLNQCVAATGRLSADKPNQQNFASEMQDVFVTRFSD